MRNSKIFSLLILVGVFCASAGAVFAVVTTHIIVATALCWTALVLIWAAAKVKL